MFWIIMFSFAVLVVLAVVIYMLPSDPVVKAKKKKEKKAFTDPPPAAVDTKDWKAIAERWEKHNHALQAEIDKMKAVQNRVQQAQAEGQSQTKDLLEKLALEKSWREKEQESLAKFKLHEKDFKDQIVRTEGDLEKEHSNRLRLERELQEVKIKYEQALEEKRQAAVKSSSQQTTLEANAREIRELKSENAKLKEKRADIQWVAKSEFDDLKKAFEAKEQEIARLKQHG